MSPADALALVFDIQERIFEWDTRNCCALGVGGR
jgi:hypothetical protein